MIAESQAMREAALSGRLGFLNTGTNRATIEVYGTVRPAAGAAPGGVPLCVIPLAIPAGSVAAGLLELEQFEDGLIASTGDAVWCRAKNGNGEIGFDMDAGEVGSSAEAIFSTTQLFAGGGLRLVSCVLG